MSTESRRVVPIRPNLTDADEPAPRAASPPGRRVLLPDRANGRFLDHGDHAVQDWRRLVKMSDLPQRLKWPALMVADYATFRTGLDIYPGNERLRKVLGYGKADRAGRALHDLCRLGWIVQVKPSAPGRNAEYALTVPYDLDDHLIYGPDEV